MMNNELSEACSEVLIILNNTSREDVKKIPDKFLKFLLENKSTEYIPNLVINPDINKVNLKPKSKALLGLIYKKYWCNSKEANEFDIILHNNQVREEEKKIQKYGIDVFSNTNSDNIIKSESSKQELSNIKEENYLKRIFNWLKSIFKNE